MCWGGQAKERIKVFEKTKLVDGRSIGARWLADGFSLLHKAVGDAKIRSA